MKKLPIGIQTFQKIVEGGYAYVDKTPFALKLIEEGEGYYSSVIYAYLNALGYDVVAEGNTNRGRIDLTLKLPNKVVIVEFKVDSSEDPLEQVERKRYYEKYIAMGLPVYLVGINFDSKERNVKNWKIKVLRS